MITLVHARDGSELLMEVLGEGGTDAGAGDSIAFHATLGQPVAGVVSNSGGDVFIGQGFWYGGFLSGGGHGFGLFINYVDHRAGNYPGAAAPLALDFIFLIWGC